jgi:type I restriction enzyme R subunit
MANFSEKSVIEDHLIEKLVEQGWKFVPANELVREGFDEPLLLNNLVGQLAKLNPGIGEEEIRQTVNELKLRAFGQEGVKQILDFYKFGVPVKFEKERVVKYVQLFDYKNIPNNEVIVSRQVICQSGEKHIRADIVLYINGIPLVIIECKNPVSFSSNWHEAYKQIKGYEKTIPELFKYLQIGVAAESSAKYFPIVPWQDDVKIYEWKEENKNSIDSLLKMLSCDVLPDIIKNFVFYRIEHGNATKVITRYMQYRAANKIVGRVLANIAGREVKKKGLIWHWQGSGKTLTMIFAANKLRNLRELESPTVFFIVDRVELEEQLSDEFSALGMNICLINNVEKLKEVIRHDDFKGRNDVMLTLVHKFRPEEMSDLLKEIEQSGNEETIQTRKNVIAFIDEGHRTQYGTLASHMKEILKNAFKFAFTGTPIAKKGRDTYDEFSYPPEETYFDKYFMTDSIRDEFTVEIAYQPRLEKDVHLAKADLEAFIETEFEEIPEEFKEKVKENVRKQLNTIKAYLENSERIEKVAEDIKNHFNKNINGKFKAIIVAVSRKACVMYKRELDKYLPREYSEVIMTFGKGDEKIIADYLAELTDKHKGKDIEDIRKDIVERYKKEEDLPKILIVTDMLLTGFDAPVLQTMYLDKPLKEHRLLQAIARTNRPFKGLKEAGLIIDYVGILKEVKKAFEMYSKEDVLEALCDMDEIRADFAALAGSMMNLFKDISKQDYDRKTLLKAIEIVTMDENTGKGFVENYKRLRRLFELLGPDEMKVEYLSSYKWLSAIYVYYIKEVLKSRDDTEAYNEKYFSKTVDYIYKTTEIAELQKNLPQIVFDDKYLEKLHEKIDSKEEKAANIVFTLNKLVLVDKQKNLIYLSIADKVEQILEKWKEKNKNYENIYLDGLNILKEIEKLKARQKELGFSDFEYSILAIMEKKLGSRRELVQDVKQISGILKKEMFNDWALQSTARKNVERELRSFLRKAIVRYDITYEKMNEVYEAIRDNLMTYGKDN